MPDCKQGYLTTPTTAKKLDSFAPQLWGPGRNDDGADPANRNADRQKGHAGGMSPLSFVASLFAICVVAGFFGSLVGLGGGIIVVPALTLIYGIPIHYAIGASIIGVIATSSGAAAAYVRDGMTNLRAAMFLEIGTTTGAISGAFLGGALHGSHESWLYLIFGAVLAVSAVAMLGRRAVPSRRSRPTPGRTACICTAVTSTPRRSARSTIASRTVEAAWY